MRALSPVLFASLLLAAAPVAAQPGPPSQATPAKTASPPADCGALHRAGVRCKTLDMGGDDVDGARPTPGGDALTARRAPIHSSLLRLRTSFRDRLLRSAEALP